MVRRILRLRVLLPVTALVLFFGGGWTLRNHLAAERQGQWIRVQRGDLVSGIEVTGTLPALESERLGPPPLQNVWDFKISMMAPEGSEVKKGRPVLAFDTTELNRRLEEKTAERDQAQKEIEKKRADLALRREDEELKLAETEAKLRKLELKLESPADILGLKERKHVELDYDLAKRERASIRARLDSLQRAASAEIRLLESKRDQAAAIVGVTQEGIRRMTVLAPRDGTIVYCTNWRGEKKKVGDPCWRQDRILEVPDLSKMMGRGEVDEVDAGKVAVGQRVTLRLEAHPDEEFHGTIKTAGRTVQLAQGTRDPLRVLRVDVVLDRTDPARMRPGMRFRGTVELNRVRSALLIPRDAVFMSADGPVVYRRGKLGVAAVPIKLGRENDKQVEVVSGLSATDRVLIAGNEEEKKAGS